MKKGSEFTFSKIMTIIIILIALTLLLIGIIFPIFNAQGGNLEQITQGSQDLIESSGQGLGEVGLS